MIQLENEIFIVSEICMLFIIYVLYYIIRIMWISVISTCTSIMFITF